MRPVDLAKTSTAIKAYQAYAEIKKAKEPVAETEPVLSVAVKLSLSDEGKKLAEGNTTKYSNLRIMKINNRSYH